MIQILPIFVPGYLIPFISKEMDGIKIMQETEHFINIKIEKNSVLGMFLRRRVRPDYKVKDYQMVIYTKKIGPHNAFSIDLLEFQNSVQYKVDLSFAELEDLYKFLSYSFSISFYFFVKGYLEVCKKQNRQYGTLMEAIRCVIDEYDLLEYGYSEMQMKELYYSYKKNGSCSVLRKNLPLPKTFL